jgi:hypothetical protein
MTISDITGSDLTEDFGLEDLTLDLERGDYQNFGLSLSELNKLVAKLKNLDPERDLHALKNIDWAISDYLTIAKKIFESTGVGRETEYKELQRILAGLGAIPCPYKPNQGITERIAALFFEPTDRKGKFLVRLADLQSRAKNLSIALKDDVYAARNLKQQAEQTLKEDRREKHGVSAWKVGICYGLFASMQVGGAALPDGLQDRLNTTFRRAVAQNQLATNLHQEQTPFVSPQISQLQTAVKQMKAELETTMQLAPAPTCAPKLRFDWENQVASQCFAVEQLENRLKRSMQAGKALILPPEEDLKKYGPKHLNLVKMNHLGQKLELTDLTIPAPHGISSNQVHDFLRQAAPQVFENWELLKQEPSLHTPRAVELLNGIDAGIDRAFSQEDAWKKLDLASEMMDWFAEMNREGHYLMVRSTGAEDSNQVANAGGNASFAYVPAHPKDVCHAIGAVVKSYFSRGSLQIRLSGGANPFEEELKLAVTTQQLIGEPLDGAKDPADIPVSFVLFTNEPLYIGTEKFRAMRISATYGHGEAVVKNQGIPTDSALILRSESQPDQLYLIYNNQQKVNRLCPQRDDEGDVALKPLENPKHMQKRPALSEKQLVDLYRSGILMESFFEDHPTDIEGVVKGDQIYFVQARPVNRKPLLPTYLASQDGVVKKHQAEMLVPGKGSVVTATDKEQVIFAPTLDEAEGIFGSKSRVEQTAIIKLVIVTQPEPENSHSVVNFSGLMMPCLYTNNPAEVQEIIGQMSEDQPLVACMQTAVVSLWDTQKAPLEGQIQEGFAVHPAKIAISLRSHVETESAAPSPEIVALLRQIPEDASALDKLEAHPQLKYLRAKARSLQARSLPLEAAKRVHVLVELDRKITKAIEEMRAVLKREPKEKLHSLLHLKILETLLVGSGQGLGRHTLSDVEPLAKEITLIADYQKELPFPAQGAHLVLLAQNNPTALPQWRQFLLNIEPLVQEGKITQDEWRQFETLVATLQQTEALPMWLTFFQEQTKSSRFHPDEIMLIARFRNIIAQATPSHLKQIDALAKQQSSFEQMQGQIDRFGNGESFLAAWKELQEHIKQLTSPEWMASIQNAPPLIKSIAYKTMEKLVDLVDKSIKTAKLGSMENKVTLVKEMLEPFLKLMRTWSEQMVPDGKIMIHKTSSLFDYLNRMDRLLNEMVDTNLKQFYPSKDNSVASAMMGSGAMFHLHEPETLEDMFTLIHQNCLVVINTLNQELLSPAHIQQSFLPEEVKNAMTLIERGHSQRTFQRIGVQIRSKEVVVHYNIPLRDHSGHVELHCDLSTGKLTLKNQLLGISEWDRWEQAAYLVNAFDATGILLLDRPLFQNHKELTFSWKVTPENLELALREYAHMAEDSFENGFTRQEFQELITRFDNRSDLQKKLKDHVWENPVGNYVDFYTDGLAAGDEKTFELAEKAAIELFKNTEDTTQATKLFAVLLKYNRGAEKALTLALNGLKSGNWDRRSNSIALFKHLFTNGLGFEESLQEARNLLTTNNVSAQNLLALLVRFGHGYSLALEAVQENPYLDPLWEALIQQGQGVELALRKANSDLESKNYNGCLSSLILLVKHDRMDPIVAFQMLEKATKSNSVLKNGLLFLLIQRNTGNELALEMLENSNMPDSTKFKWAKELLLNGIESKILTSVMKEHSHWYKDDLDFLFKLAQKEKHNQLCLEIILRLQKQQPYDIAYLLPAMGALVSQGVGYDEAISLLKMNEFIFPVSVIKYVTLAKALVEKGQYDPIILAIVEEAFTIKSWIRDLDKSSVQTGLDICSVLFKRSDLNQELVQLATKIQGAGTTDNSLSIKLFKMALDNGIGFDERQQ